MTRGKRVALAMGAAAALLVAACSSSQGGSTPNPTVAGSTPPGPSTSRSADPTVAVSDWPAYGHDLSNSRTNGAETKIDARTVAGLTPRWSKDGLVAVTGTPTVWRGVAYFDDWTGTAWAVQASTGAKIWSTHLGSGFIVGAAAVSDQAVFVAVGNKLFGLDRATGAIRWTAVTNESRFAQINASPVVVDGTVLQGTAQLEEVVGKAPYTFRGSIGGYDAATGKERWRFYSTPADATSGAGNGIWSTPAVDTELGLAYVGTGQALAKPTGPLADSILAVDYRTGKLRWSHQFTHPDVFSTGDYSGKDADVGASPNLWSSSGRALVGVGSKNGIYYALDRRSGKVAWETKVAPGSVFGGVLGSSAYVDGKLVVSSNIGNPVSNQQTGRARVVALNPATGAILWTAKEFAGSIFGPISAVPGVAFVGTDKAVLTALDTRSGAPLWTFTAPGKVASGPSIVDGEVLWGYGFNLFGPSGKGGMLAFGLGP